MKRRRREIKKERIHDRASHNKREQHEKQEQEEPENVVEHVVFPTALKTTLRVLRSLRCAQFRTVLTIYHDIESDGN